MTIHGQVVSEPAIAIEDVWDINGPCYVRFTERAGSRLVLRSSNQMDRYAVSGVRIKPYATSPRSRAISLTCAVLALFAFGCVSSAAEKSPAGKAQTAKAPAGQVQADEWETLLTGDWTISPGAEDYVCVRYTLSEDTYIRGVAAVNPLGTHHTNLTIGDPTKPDGTYPCTVAENLSVSVFGSGVGTDPVEFPEGVGMKLAAGTQLLLNLHLFNAGDGELSGTSGTRILPTDSSEIEHLAEDNPAVVLNLNILPNQDTTTTGSYTVPHDSTLFAVLPHMHQFGIHSKVVAHSSLDGDRVLHDMPYSFDAQLYYPIESIRMASGDKIDYECTWRNTTSRTVHFGQSSLDEMCAMGLYRYPGM